MFYQGKKFAAICLNNESSVTSRWFGKANPTYCKAVANRDSSWFGLGEMTVISRAHSRRKREQTSASRVICIRSSRPRDKYTNIYISLTPWKRKDKTWVRPLRLEKGPPFGITHFHTCVADLRKHRGINISANTIGRNVISPSDSAQEKRETGLRTLLNKRECLSELYVTLTSAKLNKTSKFTGELPSY